MEDCTCHACIHHTKAYIHHLLLCRELLGEVLLYHHNRHQLYEFMKEARSLIASNPKNMKEFVKYLKNTYALGDDGWTDIVKQRKAKATDRHLKDD